MPRPEPTVQERFAALVCERFGLDDRDVLAGSVVAELRGGEGFGRVRLTLALDAAEVLDMMLAAGVEPTKGGA